MPKSYRHALHQAIFYSRPEQARASLRKQPTAWREPSRDGESAADAAFIQWLINTPMYLGHNTGDPDEVLRAQEVWEVLHHHTDCAIPCRLYSPESRPEWKSVDLLSWSMWPGASQALAVTDWLLDQGVRPTPLAETSLAHPPGHPLHELLMLVCYRADHSPDALAEAVFLRLLDLPEWADLNAWGGVWHAAHARMGRLSQSPGACLPPLGAIVAGLRRYGVGVPLMKSLIAHHEAALDVLAVLIRHLLDRGASWDAPVQLDWWDKDPAHHAPFSGTVRDMWRPSSARCAEQLKQTICSFGSRAGLDALIERLGSAAP